MSQGLSILTTEYVQWGTYSEQLNHKNLITSDFNGELYLFAMIWILLLLQSNIWKPQKIIFQSWDASHIVMVTYRKPWNFYIWGPQWEPWCYVCLTLLSSESVPPSSSEAPRLLRCPNHGCYSPQGHLSQPRHPHWKCGQRPQCGLLQHGESVSSFTPSLLLYVF